MNVDSEELADVIRRLRRDGIVLYAQPGALPESALEQLLTEATELDMDEVRTSLHASADA